VLLDLMLPKMNGTDILKKIRAQSRFASVPVIVFTNAYVPNMIQEAFSAGASQVFNKATLTPRQILDALHVLLTGGTASGGTTIVPLQAPPSSTGHTSVARKPEAASDPLGQLTESSFASTPPKPAEGSPPPPRPFVTPQELKAAAGPAARPAQPRINSDDAAFQAELCEAFVASKTETMATLRRLLQDFTKASDDAGREPHLLELYRKVHSLTGSAGIAGFTSISQLTAALEVLLKELHEKPKNINASICSNRRSRKPVKSRPPTSSWWTTKSFPAAPSLTRSKRPT
jgi:HPt (histidine-containing phosphotransfer) domain-containing protein